MSFLKAEWRNLAIANYVINKDVLKPHLPAGTELDLWEGKCYVSAVAFMFQNTKILGIKIPFHINFEEVNLRFYVKRFDGDKWKRGVVFIKEIVPKRAITFVANTIYKENYATRKMKHEWEVKDDSFFVKYHWKNKNKWSSIQIEATKELFEIELESETEFITEHYWGYAKVNEHVTNEYEVTHPKWKKYSVLSSYIDVDFEANYGQEFAFLNKQEPHSVMLAEGSEITVEGKRKIKLT
jgi:uncharacterized protein YqjF (DUF2071 family)